jgi:hypothetical protein
LLFTVSTRISRRSIIASRSPFHGFCICAGSMVRVSALPAFRGALSWAWSAPANMRQAKATLITARMGLIAGF